MMRIKTAWCATALSFVNITTMNHSKFKRSCIHNIQNFWLFYTDVTECVIEFLLFFCRKTTISRVFNFRDRNRNHQNIRLSPKTKRQRNKWTTRRHAPPRSIFKTHSAFIMPRQKPSSLSHRRRPPEPHRGRCPARAHLKVTFEEIKLAPYQQQQQQRPPLRQCDGIFLARGVCDATRW